MRFFGLLLLLAACAREAPVAGEFTPAVPIAGQEPIPYPAELFSQGVEGEVMLYLVVDSTGSVIRDSTRVEKSSGQSAFDGRDGGELGDSSQLEDRGRAVVLQD